LFVMALVLPKVNAVFLIWEYNLHRGS
jgi:hypothetical protein